MAKPDYSKYLVHIYWVDQDAICTTDDSCERSCHHEFDTLVEAEKFMMLYKLTHNCMPSGTDEWINANDPHEITLISPEQKETA